MKAQTPTKQTSFILNGKSYLGTESEARQEFNDCKGDERFSYNSFTEYCEAHRETIDLTPSWNDALNICLFLLENGDKAGKFAAIGELRKMAQLADYYVETVRANRIENKVNTGS